MSSAIFSFILIQTYNAKEIATEFANYFSSVGREYANKIEQSDSDIQT